MIQKPTVQASPITALNARQGGYQAPMLRAASEKISGTVKMTPIAEMTQRTVTATGRLPMSSSGAASEVMIVSASG
jgi:hypothetical protein